MAWVIAAMVTVWAGIWAGVSGPSWTGGLIVALSLTLSFSLRRRFEVDRTTGHLRVAWVVSLTPGGPCITLKDLVHGALGAYRHVQVQPVIRTVHTQSGTTRMTEYHVQLAGPVTLGFGQLASASDEQNAALAGVFGAFVLGSPETARRAAMQLAKDLELSLQDSPPSPPVHR